MASQPRSLSLMRLALGKWWIALIILGLTAATAAACLKATPTTLTTSLSGGGKEGEEITVTEGTGVKDTATLKGENAGKATGTVKYAVYKDKACKELVTEAGKVTVKEGKVPASEEKKLEAGTIYYWQAEYGGDSLDEASKSTCGKEVLTVKATTSLKITLSGGGKEGEEITVAEGSKIKATATLSGTKSSTATGTVKYAVYKDKECKELVAEAGKGSVEGGKAGGSEEKELEAGAVYYWQAEYGGDGLHEASKGNCAKVTIKATISLTTSLSGGGKEGKKITVSEGSSIKDQVTLSGSKASTATGTAKYAVYADEACKELVTNAGEGAVVAGSAPASDEKKLEAGAAYYWKVTYSGDSLHEASESTCSEEVLSIVASTSLKTTLSGGGKEGEKITVVEGAGVKDQATLSGANASKATGTVKYAVYKDEECKELVTKAGESSFSGTVPASEEKELKAAAVYYWQAEYSGDGLHKDAGGTCGKEVLTVKAKTSISTVLVGEELPWQEPISGEKITVSSTIEAADTVELGGTEWATATGTVSYSVYEDSECKELVTGAGEFSVEFGIVPASKAPSLKPGVYYWTASYSGDSLHESSASSCSEVLTIVPATSLTTSLEGEGKIGESIEGASTLTVAETAAVTDTATLHGENASEATGTLSYNVYADAECTELVAEAGAVSVEGESVPSSTPKTLEPGTYYWQVKYSGDEHNYPVGSLCGSEIEVVTQTITTSLSGGEESGPIIEVPEGTAVSDKATILGEHASEATGTVSYFVYSDSECTTLLAEAGEVTVWGASVPPSEEEELEPGHYYWQAEYSGDGKNPASTSECGAEALYVVAPTTISMILSGGGEEGEEIKVDEEDAVTAQAFLSGPETAGAAGMVEYTLYSDAECTKLAGIGGAVEVGEGSVSASEGVISEAGSYYWRARYSGDGINKESISPCGSVDAVVTVPSESEEVTTTLTSGEFTGNVVEVAEGASVSEQAVLHGEHASKATGTMKYVIYTDVECTEVFKSVGEVTVSGGSVPASPEVKMSEGLYYWQAEYSGDKENPAATSICGESQVRAALPAPWRYAGLGDSYSAGEGAGNYYAAANQRFQHGRRRQFRPWKKNLCHRSSVAWPTEIARALFGAGVTAENEVIKQLPPSFIFRACSGAVAQNIWGGRPGVAKAPTGGQYDEWMDPGGGAAPGWLTTPAQDLWLKNSGAGEPPAFNDRVNATIKTVTLSVGGNDAGFATIGKNCVRQVGFYRAAKEAKCMEVIEEWLFRVARAPGTLVVPSQREGIPSIPAKLRETLNFIHAWAPLAKIRVVLYPRVLNINKRPTIPLGAGFSIDNGHRRYVGPFWRRLTVAEVIDIFIANLNATIAQTVQGWGAMHNARGARIDVRPIFSTVNSFLGRQLGDPAPFMNGIILPFWVDESFHPNAAGQQRLAEAVWPEL